MDRYVTRWYVAVTPEEAERLRRLDNTPSEEVRHTPGVELLHAHGSWSYWSDGKVLRRTGGNLPNVPVALTKDAERLIDSVIGSDSGHVDGGAASLAQVDRILSTETVSIGPSRGVYARSTIERLQVRLSDGTETTLWTYSAGYFEGYAFDVYRSKESLLEGLKAYG